MTKHARTLVVAAIILLGASAWETFGQQPKAQPLTIGATQKGVAGSDQPAIYRFEAAGPGLLTVATRGTGSADLYLFVADEDGQSLPDGTSDRDLGGIGGRRTGGRRAACPRHLHGSGRIRGVPVRGLHHRRVVGAVREAGGGPGS